jgi:hypothetical protein
MKEIITMRTIRLLGLAFFAVLAFSVVGAVGGATPASALLFLTLSGKELLFEVKSLRHLNATPANPTLLSRNGNVECELLLGRGAILNKTDEARKIRLEFHRCNVQGFPALRCTTEGVAGEKPGLIITLLLKALLVTLLEVRGQETKYALKIESEERAPHLATFFCEGIGTVVVQGSVVGDFEESLRQSQTPKEEAALLFGKFVSQDYWTLRNGIGTAKLEANLGFGFEPAEEDALVDIRAEGKVSFCHN